MDKDIMRSKPHCGNCLKHRGIIGKITPLIRSLRRLYEQVNKAKSNKKQRYVANIPGDER
jgi:hypothetical protein